MPGTFCIGRSSAHHHRRVVESHIVETKDTVTSDGQIACLCLSEPRFRDVLCRDSSEWMSRLHRDGAAG